MRTSNWTPSIVPDDQDQTIYMVANDFGKIGRAWVEADYETTDLETVIQDLLTGQYSNPIRVVAFNTAERWSEDVSEDVAHGCDWSNYVPTEPRKAPDGHRKKPAPAAAGSCAGAAHSDRNAEKAPTATKTFGH